MKELKNKVEIAGYVDKLSKSISIDKYGNPYYSFIIEHPRENSSNNYFRCKIINNQELCEKAQKLKINQFVTIKGELIDYMVNHTPKTIIIVKEIKV